MLQSSHGLVFLDGALILSTKDPMRRTQDPIKDPEPYEESEFFDDPRKTWEFIN